MKRSSTLHYLFLVILYEIVQISFASLPAYEKQPWIERMIDGNRRGDIPHNESDYYKPVMVNSDTLQNLLKPI